MAGYRLARTARRDLADIWDYIAKDSPINANRFLKMIAKRVHLLGSNPYAGRSRDELRPGLRSFPVGDYLIFYRVRKSLIEIARVLHGRRKLSDQRL